MVLFCKTFFGHGLFTSEKHLLCSLWCIWCGLCRIRTRQLKILFPMYCGFVILFLCFKFPAICLRLFFRVKQICQTIQLLPGVTYWFKSAQLFCAYDSTWSKICTSNEFFKYLKTGLIFTEIELYLVVVLINVYAHWSRSCFFHCILFFPAIFQIVTDFYMFDICNILLRYLTFI